MLIEAQRLAIEKMKKEPEWAKIAFGTLNDIEMGLYGDFVNVVVQKSWHNPIDFIDAYYFIQVHAMALSGEVMRLSVDVKRGPYKDDMIKENNTLLKNMPDLFEGRFNPSVGGGSGTINGDGYIKWNKTIFMERNILQENGKIRKEIRKVKSDRIPLEVGTTNAETTYAHIKHFGNGVARLPYRFRSIEILYKFSEKNHKLASFKEWMNNNDIEKLPYFDDEIVCSDGVYVWNDKEKTYTSIQ